MGRGLFSGILWGALISVMSLWVLSQVGGMVGLMEQPDSVITAAPDPVTGADVSDNDQTPVEPAIEQKPKLDTARPGETAELAAVDDDPTPVAPTPTSPVPDPTEIVVIPQAPNASGENQVSVGSGITLTSDARVANAGQPVLPGVDNLPVVNQTTPEPAPSPAAETTTQAPPQPANTETTPVTPIENVAVLAPNSTSGPGQPVSPGAETAPAVETATAVEPTTAPGGNFTTPVVVTTPQTPLEPVETPSTSGDQPQLETASADPVPNADVLDGDGQLESAGSLQNLAQNVRTNRLPTIGVANAELTPAPTLGDGDPDQQSGVGPGSGLAIESFAQAFENPENRPLMAIVLLPQVGQSSVNPSPLPFPVSYVVDASHDDAEKTMRAVRNQGSEVAALMPLPNGASPQDVETSFQIYLNRVHEAVAVIDTEQANFQSGRAVSAQVVQVLAATGHGMITYSKGLNSAPQMAEREGVPAALVFRSFDNEGQDVRAIKRFLDQAAFRAGQQSGVILVGHDRPETIKAVLEWSLGNRANTVALAPVSAVLLNQ